MAETNHFTAGEYVVYPVHGVGRVVGLENQEYSGFALNVYVISFDGDRMTLSVPVHKAHAVGLRPLSSAALMNKAIETLKGKAVVRKAMWSRRAQEYESKINSGDPVSIAEVMRDLYRGVGQPEPSYSERQLFKSALERLTRELALIEAIASTEAQEKLQGVLAASA